jgi:hypothetical protein
LAGNNSRLTERVTISPWSIHQSSGLNSIREQTSLGFVCSKKGQFNLIHVMRFFLTTAMVISHVQIITSVLYFSSNCFHSFILRASLVKHLFFLINMFINPLTFIVLH